MPKKSVKILLSQSQAAGLAGHLAADVLLYPLGKQQNIHAYFPYTYIGTFIVIDFFLDDVHAKCIHALKHTMNYLTVHGL